MFTGKIAEGLPSARGSRGRLEQVLLNLIVNASEAMNGKGTLRLSARLVSEATGCLLAPRAASRYVELAVGDSGPGIPPEKLPRIFEAYFTTKQRGTGLGLAIVRNNVELYGGTITAESELGKGTRFTLVFPAKAALHLRP